MKRNITLSAEENIIQSARKRAMNENTTLNAEFRRWLEKYALRSQNAQDFLALMDRFAYVNAGRNFSRDEMNER
ncbi:MAG: hypothetical protein ISR58_21410 [Anaerolineales bacterium]|nr:hypothetical protein [Chloroflexota bacterium]MBL6983749.1 hypothetical protein [Anaerolineales bacterium]